MRDLGDSTKLDGRTASRSRCRCPFHLRDLAGRVAMRDLDGVAVLARPGFSSLLGRPTRAPCRRPPIHKGLHVYGVAVLARPGFSSLLGRPTRAPCRRPPIHKGLHAAPPIPPLPPLPPAKPGSPFAPKPTTAAASAPLPPAPPIPPLPPLPPAKPGSPFAPKPTTAAASAPLRRCRRPRQCLPHRRHRHYHRCRRFRHWRRRPRLRRRCRRPRQCLPHRRHRHYHRCRRFRHWRRRPRLPRRLQAATSPGRAPSTHGICHHRPPPGQGPHGSPRAAFKRRLALDEHHPPTAYAITVHRQARGHTAHTRQSGIEGPGAAGQIVGRPGSCAVVVPHPSAIRLRVSRESKGRAPRGRSWVGQAAARWWSPTRAPSVSIRPA